MTLETFLSYEIQFENMEMMLKSDPSCFNGVTWTLGSRKGLALTVGGSQLDHVRHFVVLGRMRSWRSGRWAETGRTPITERPPLFHQRTERRAAAGPGPGHLRASLSASARCAVMLALGCRAAAWKSSRWDRAEIVYWRDESHRREITRGCSSPSFSDFLCKNDFKRIFAHWKKEMHTF